MSLKQIIVKNATTMSLHERFTKISKNKESSSYNERIIQQLTSSQNRRLAQQLEKRAMVAALKKVSIKNRLGLPGAISVRERLRLPRGFGAKRGRGVIGKSPLTRGLNRGGSGATNILNLPVSRSRARSPFLANSARRRSRSRSRSMLVLPSRSRSRARSRSNTRYRSRSRSHYDDTNFSSVRRQHLNRRSNFRRGRGGRLQTLRNDLKSYRPKLGNESNYFRMGNSKRKADNFTRGRIRGRAFRTAANNVRNKRWNKPSLTKEELDRELDQYMSTTKANLDKELDTIMNEDTWN